MSELSPKKEDLRRAHALLVRANDLHRQEQRHTEAIELARQATSCGEPRLQGIAYDLIGGFFYSLDDLPAAEAAYLQALEFHRWPGTYVFLSNICELTDRADEALSHLQQALEIDRDYDEAHYLLGRQYRRRELFAQAEKHLRRAIELDAHYYLAMTELAICLRLQHRYDESKKWLKAAIALAPNYLWSGLWYANVLWKLDEIIEADHAYQRILKYWPEESVTNWTYADFLSSEFNSPALAEKLFTRALELDPKDPCAHYFFAKHWRSRGDEDKAIAELSVAAELGHKHAQELLNKITSG